MELLDRIIEAQTEEAHAFNVIKSKDGYVLVDYSMPVTCFDNNAKPKILFPFMGEMTNEEFEEFRNGGVLKNSMIMNLLI